MTDTPKAITADMSPEETEKRAKTKETAEVQHQQDLMWLLSDARGRRLALQWIAKTNALGLGFHPDLGQMAFAQGRRSIGVEFMADLKATVPKLYPAIFSDAQNS